MSEFDLVVTAIIVVLSAARITRLLIVDDFPPIVWARDRYRDVTDGSLWQDLSFCAYCAGFWVVVAVLVTGWACDWNFWWLLVNTAFAASYVVAWIVKADTDWSERVTK